VKFDVGLLRGRENNAQFGATTDETFNFLKKLNVYCILGPVELEQITQQETENCDP